MTKHSTYEVLMKIEELEEQGLDWTPTTHSQNTA